MPHLLETRLSEVRRRVRQTLWAYGLSWTTVFGLCALFLVGFGDWAFHFDDPGVRLILGLLILAGTAVVCYRFLWRPLVTRLTNVDLAVRIEDRYPDFDDSLVSTVEFLKTGISPHLGSPGLQQAVIRQTMARVERLDFGDIIQTRPARRIAAAALGVCIFAAVFVALNQSASAVALQRLFRPFSAPAWPRQTSLRLLSADLVPLEFDAEDPLRIARGDTLKLLVENRAGRLPSKIRFEYRFGDGDLQTDILRPTTLRDELGRAREVAPAEIVARQGPLEFRAVGGDDDTMPFYRALVFPPPQIESLQVTLQPPSYTGRPAEQLPAGAGHVQGLLGTRVTIEATVNKRLRSAILRIKDQEQAPTVLKEDQQHFTTSFVIAEEGVYSYWFELLDLQGFESREALRYEIRGVRDQVPEIFIDDPAADMLVTADAEVPVTTTAKDDLGLSAIRLQFRTGEAHASPEISIPLAGDPEHPFEGNTSPQQWTATYPWKLSELKLAPGSRVVFHTEATDAYVSDTNPSDRHVGRSVARTLTIVSGSEKVRELAQRQAGLLEELERTFKLQDHAHDQIEELQVQLREAGQLRDQDADMLQRVELNQRRITGQLHNPGEGLADRAGELLDELQSNKLEDPEMDRRLSQMVQELGRLSSENLPVIEQELTRARKELQSNPASPAAGRSTEGGQPSSTAPSPEPKAAPHPKPGTSKAKKSETPKPSSSPKTETGEQSREASPQKPQPERRPSGSLDESLQQVAENQSAVLESLEEMLQQLSQWRNERDAAGELAEITSEQQQLNEQTATLGQQTLARPRSELAPQQQADLARLGERQRKHAERFEQLQSRMQQMIEQLSKSDADAAASLQQTLDEARKSSVAGQMRETASEINANRMGEAGRRQLQVMQQLRELEDLLLNRPETDTELLVKKLQQESETLQKLREEQAEQLRNSRQLASSEPTPQQQEQMQKLQQDLDKLADEIDSLSRRLQRLQLRPPAESTRRAADRLRQARSDLDEDAVPQSQGQQQEAHDDLEQAQRELAREKREAEERLAYEQLEKMSGELQELAHRQDAVIGEIRRLDDLHTTRGSWTRGQLKSLLELVKTQRDLQAETDRLASKVEAAAVIALSLQGAGRKMQRTADRLAERQSDRATQAMAAAARKRLGDILESLKNPPPGKKKPQQDQQPGEGGGSDGPPGEMIPSLAQLKMLKILQDELRQRTSQLAGDLPATGDLSTEQRQELDDISAEQGKLADLARELITQNTSDEAEQPGESDAPSDRPQSPPARGEQPETRGD